MNTMRRLRTVGGILAVAALMLPALTGCRTNRTLMVERLFFNHRHVNIAHIDDGSDDSLSMGGAVSEMVSYTNRGGGIDRLGDGEKTYTSESDQLDTAAVYRLTEVRVTAPQSYTPERDGKLMLQFYVNVPKEVLSTNWRLLLSPEMRYADTTVQMPEMQIKGADFYAFQQKGYADWDAFLASIIDAGDYDKYFLDWGGIEGDIKMRQQYYLDEYNKEAEKFMKYYRYKKLLEDRYDFANTKAEINKQRLYHKKVRSAQFKKATRGVSKSPTERYNKTVAFWPHYHMNRELSVEYLPKRYRQAFLENRTLNDVRSKYVDKLDSMEIVTNRYMVDQIVYNQRKDSLKNLKFREFVPYPYLEDLQLDTVVSEGSDLRYLYTFLYPFQPGMKSIDVSMTGKAEAIDMSTFDLRNTDTLNFRITSMDQLVDTNLIYKRTRIYRNLFANLTLNLKYKPNATDVDINFQDNKKQIDTLLASWRSYRDRGLHIDSVTMTASSSLDGAYDFNMKLSEKRANSLKDYLIRTAPAEMDVERTFRAYHIGEDWRNMLRLVQQNPRLKYKEKIVDMLTSSRNPDGTEWELSHGSTKTDYKIIREDIYPKLRKVDLVYYLSYPGMVATDSVIVEYREDYARAIEMFNDRNYWGALDILSQYPDYNLALCLANLGFNARAYDLLVQLEQNANVEYLKAIVCYRLEEKNDAVRHLLKACELDRGKIYRAPRDPEVRALIQEYNLYGKLNELKSTPMSAPEESSDVVISSDQM